MKKVSILFTTLLSLPFLVGCGGSSKPAEHVHDYDKDNIDWCFVPTVSGGYSASATFVCKTCSESTSGHEKEVPAGVSKEIHSPTCTEDGDTTYTATVSFEGKQYSKDKVIPISKTGHHYEAEYSHNETHHFHKCQDCDAHIDEEAHVSFAYENDGTHHWKECQVCQGIYEKEPHNASEVVADDFIASEATCTTDKTYYKSCSECGKKTSYTFTVSGTKLNHDFVYHAAKTPVTCAEPGNIAYYTCTKCGDGHYYLDNTDPHAQETPWSEIIVTLPHDMETHAAKEPECETTGNEVYYTCKLSGDNNIYKDDKGIEKYSSLSDTVIPAKGHSFAEDGNCTACTKTMKTTYGLSDVDDLDLLPKKTTTDIGMQSPTSVTGNEFATVDFQNEPNIDLYYTINYSTSVPTALHRLYLFNNKDETGAIFRLNYSRTDNDGIVPCYFYTASSVTGYGEGTTLDKESAPTLYYFPRVSGMKANQDNVINIRAWLIDPATNKYRINVRGGVDADHLYNLTTNAEDKTNTLFTRDIVLGDELSAVTHNKIRFNSNAGTTAVIKSSGFPVTNTIIYRSAFGTIYGKKSYSVGDDILLPASLSKEGYTFSCWKNQKGEVVAPGVKFTSDDIYTAYFTQN